MSAVCVYVYVTCEHLTHIESYLTETDLHLKESAAKVRTGSEASFTSAHTLTQQARKQA